MESVPAVNQIPVSPNASAATAIIRVEDAHKYYELGETFGVVNSWRSWEPAAVANQLS
jgi:hypothetical protein